ncbi:VOC family protein [Mucilaginibacter sp. CSA2-8R]|uniref:VOC family protein n=1 Tax=Mucilaginibacter sp. CSA2-8R TaxID=3141542 RepID=UPI00315CA67B
MAKIVAYLHFKDNCREAMTFYQHCLGGEVEIMIVKESPMAGQMPPHMQDLVLHSSLNNGELSLLGSEMPDSSATTVAQPVALMLVCNTRQEAVEKFEKLAEGGNVTHPIHDFFAGTMGNLVDKFGFCWGVYSEETSAAVDAK